MSVHHRTFLRATDADGSAGGNGLAGSTADRADELLETMLTIGLTGAERRELDALLGDAHAAEAAFEDAAEEFERVGAAMSIAFIEAERRGPAAAGVARSDAVPTAVLRTLREAASDFVAGTPAIVADDLGLETRPELRLAGDSAEITRGTPPASGGVSLLTWGGWIAAAACLLVAVLVMQPGGGTIVSSSQANVVDAVRAASDHETCPTLGLDDAFGADRHEKGIELAGALEWSDELNAGFMQLRGLAENDPDEYQYQLWIFDAERPIGQLERFANPDLPILSQRPVDGGVFNFKPGPDGTATIPVAAKLPIGDAVIFAVTIEPPGGSVVSDRDIVFVAVSESGASAG